MINFEDKDREIALHSLERDSLFFSKLDIMDFSLLLGVQIINKSLSKEKRKSMMEKAKSERGLSVSKDGKFIYFFGIIDYLQKYNFSKVLEHTVKVIRDPPRSRQISAVPSKLYAKRYIHFMRKHVFCSKE